jgi:nucleoporin GLE1
VPLADFLHTLPSDISQPDIPALFLYLLNVFSKCLIGQFIGEVAIAPRTATTIGITGGTIFSQNDCQWHGHSLIDIFIAKYHRVCPVLFGVYGNEKTGAGKSRIGWWMEGGTYVTEQRHNERMTGLGAGFASMVLRSYRNRQSPYPAWHFWQATSRILNVPKDRVTATHLVVLKAMVEGNEQRILEFFGRAGLVLLRVALKEFPASLPIREGVAAKALLLIPDVLRTEKKLFL